MTDQQTGNYASVQDVPTDLLANRVVGRLILAKGNLNAYEAIIAMLIRELRGGPHPKSPTVGASVGGKNG